MSKLRKEHAEIKVQFLDEMTSFVSKINLQKCRNIGLNCYLNTPERRGAGWYVYILDTTAEDNESTLRSLF